MRSTNKFHFEKVMISNVKVLSRSVFRGGTLPGAFSKVTPSQACRGGFILKSPYIKMPNRFLIKDAMEIYVLLIILLTCN